MALFLGVLGSLCSCFATVLLWPAGSVPASQWFRQHLKRLFSLAGNHHHHLNFVGILHWEGQDFWVLIQVLKPCFCVSHCPVAGHHGNNLLPCVSLTACYSSTQCTVVAGKRNPIFFMHMELRWTKAHNTNSYVYALLRQTLCI